MAKAGQDETADATRQDQEERDAGVRNSAQAGRDAEGSAGHFPLGAAEFLSGTMARPYVDMLRGTNAMTHQWNQGVRTLVEQALEFTSKAHEAAMNGVRRTADCYLQLWDRGASLQRSLLREAEGQADRHVAKTRAQTAE